MDFSFFFFSKLFSIISTNFRYENLNSKILAWEDEKKTQAKFNMEKNKVLPQPLMFTC